MSSDLKNKTFTYLEYLESGGIIEQSYELVAGEIVRTPPEKFSNINIALQLILLLAQHIEIERITTQAEIIISGSKVTARIPDITVFSESEIAQTAQLDRAIINIDMLPPLLVVEIVSPGKVNHDRDYRYKRCEYAARGIPHYWIVDPMLQKFTCLWLVDGMYEETVYENQGETIRLGEPIELEIDLKQIFGVAQTWDDLD